MYPHQVKIGVNSTRNNHIEVRSTEMSRICHRLLTRILPIVAATLISTVPETLNAQAPSEQFRCSDGEQAIPSPTGQDPVRIEDVGVFVNPPPPDFVKSCKLTFTTEAATNRPDIQLMALSYALQPVAFAVFPPPPPEAIPEEECKFPRNAPFITNVIGGVDETTTFINPGVEVPSALPPPANFFEIIPCLQAGDVAGVSSEFRIRNHCLIVECRESRIIP